MFKVFFKRSAEKELRRLPLAIIKRIELIIGELKDEVSISNIKKMIGSSLVYRVRVGDYRVVYVLDNELKTITIIKIAHRKDVYR